MVPCGYTGIPTQKYTSSPPPPKLTHTHGMRLPPTSVPMMMMLASNDAHFALPTRLPSTLRPAPSMRALDIEEVAALAGVWRADLDLDTGVQQSNLHLDAAGRVHTTDDAQFNICRGTTWTSARWSASLASSEAEGVVAFTLQLGILCLEGRGVRNGLRCTTLSGSCLEGGDEPCCVGTFTLTLALPTTTDVSDLEKQHQARLMKRPAPPPTFRRSGFVGRWRLLLSMDSNQAGGDAPPAYFALLLHEDRSFSSEGGPHTLAGTWGVWGQGSFVQPQGTSLWLKVNRDRCSETFRGLADLPLRESFSLWGKPLTESLEAEIQARTPHGGTVDRVDGRLCCGEVERVYFGMFSLMRDIPIEEDFGP